jgi:hypothetical protein
MAALLKIALTVFLATVLGLIALGENACDTSKPPSPTPTSPPTKVSGTSEVPAEVTNEDLLRCIEVTKETRMILSSIRNTGTLRGTA